MTASAGDHSAPERDAPESHGTPSRMSLTEASRLLHAARHHDEIVITGMGVAREWMALGAGPLDLVYVPSSMGQATSVGLGLALAVPDRKVIVCNGDGSMLMNLGSLVSISAAAPGNLVVLVFDNGVYEITGAQPTPGAARGRQDGRDIDFAAIAQACRFRSTRHVHDAASWERDVRAILDAPGPTFVVLDVAPVPNAPGPRSPGPGAERARRFMTAVAKSDQALHPPGAADRAVPGAGLGRGDGRAPA